MRENGSAVAHSDLSRVRAVIFDLDGTLVDTKRFPVIASQNLFARLEIDSEALFQRFLASLIAEYFRLIDAVVDGAEYIRPWEIIRRSIRVALNDIGVSIEDETLDSATDEFHRLHLELSQLYPGAADLLSVLRGRGVRMAVITNSFEGDTETILRREGVVDYFDVIVDGAIARTYKPHPRPFRIALEGLDATPEEALVIGDEYYADMVGAHRAGLRAFWVNVRGRPLDEYTRKFGEQTRPLLTVSVISELLPIFASDKPQA